MSQTVAAQSRLVLSELAPGVMQSEIRAMTTECDRIGGINLAQGICDTDLPQVVSESAVEAIRSGIAFGFAGQVEGIVGRLRQELGENTPVIATGGLARVVVPFARATIDEVDDLLTLTGLRLIWELNAEPAAM